MPRKRTMKITAKRHSKIPPEAAPKAATSAPTVVVSATPVVETAKKAVVTAPVVDAKPGVATTGCAKAAESTPAKATAAPCQLKALHSADADTARDAATALGALADKAAVGSLVEVLNNADGFFHSVVRAAAASSLGQIGDRTAVEPLLNAITDPIAEVSSESIRALAVLGDTRATDALIDVVQNRSGYFLPVTRQAAIHALAKLGGERAATELRTVASSEWEEPAIRSAAKAGVTCGAGTVKA